MVEPGCAHMQSRRMRRTKMRLDEVGKLDDSKIKKLLKCLRNGDVRKEDWRSYKAMADMYNAA